MMKKLPSLRRQLALHVSAMVLGVCLIGAAAVAGLNALHENLGDALQGYDRLRQLYEAGVPALAARDALASDGADIDRAIRSLDVALVRLDPSTPVVRDVRQRVLSAMAMLRSPTTSPGDRSDALNSVLGAMAHASVDIRQQIAADRAAAELARHRAISVVSAVAIVAISATGLVGWHLYRIVSGPIAAVAAAARRLASGRWDERVESPGSAELAALALDFNRMADQLADLHHHMEQKVLAQSEQLARSQRLASVGFLAAGVAHEINNPLGIIVGYGERSMRRLSAVGEHPNVALARDAIRIMCDEAFRCRAITDRLLSLSRGDGEARQCVSLTRIWRDAIADLSADARFAACAFIIECPPDETADVIAEPGQMRQLAINLLTNAAEAYEQLPNRVTVRIANVDGAIQVETIDNGHGMTPQTIGQIFEPFFTTRRGSRPGTGLGLSIAHGIVTAHGGQISADSGGAGLGSRFIVRLPAAGVMA